MSFGTIGVARYRRDQWDRLKAVCEDSDKMSATYESWQTWTENLVNQLKERGANVVDVDVDVEEFVTWCREKNFMVEGNARKRYVNEQLAKKLFNGK